MKWISHAKWLLTGFGLTSLMMAIVNVISYQNAMQLVESTNRSLQTYEVIKNLVDLFATMTVAESGRRGYVFLNDEQELNRYQLAIRAMGVEMQALQQQLAKNPAQTTRLQTLNQLLDQRIALLGESIQLYQRDRTAIPAQKQITHRSINLRGQIQAAIAEMQREEENSLRQWQTESQVNIRTRVLIEFLVTCFSFAILSVVCLLLYRQLMKRQEAEALGKLLEREKELSNLKLRFFSMVSHEFRTPLSIISGSAQMLAENKPEWTEDRRLKNIHRIQSSTRLMTHYLTDILTLTRAEAGKLECNPEPLDVEAFCLNLVEDLQVAELNEHQIQFQSQGQCGLVNLDEKLLYCILSNLLLNAMKYSAPGSTIQLKLQCGANETLFQVYDQGIGISPEEQQYLYQPFYRGVNAADIHGTGLGLVVVRTCVDLHHGHIEVTSQAGAGTTFSIWIPHVKLTRLAESRSAIA
ncbi:MAG: CHASE3 domain-containing protein [Oscillatoriales cyanobacterium C42_A2020_001]|nr:CHASE3 domain-containing protein [Leptolyngbyaceae cyanobacterium C42_A2020_001]